MLQFSIKIRKKLILLDFEKSQYTGSFLCPDGNGLLGIILHLVVVASEVLPTHYHYFFSVDFFFLLFICYHPIFLDK